MKVRIGAISYHLPSTVEGPEALKKDNPDWDLPKILEKTGVLTRHVASDGETAADLAFRAGSGLFEERSDARDSDLLILVTQSPDYFLPTSACVLQDRLGLSKNCMAFDINLGCSGFVSALSIAGGLIETGSANKAIILCADTYLKYIAKDDRTCRPIFSDGAAAVLLEKCDSDSIGPFVSGTDGAGFDKLIVKRGGARNPLSIADPTPSRLEMHGSDVFMFTMNVVPTCVRKLLERSGLALADIDLFVFHQASKLVIDTLIRRLALDSSKVFTNYETVGNTVSATIPIALKQAASQGRLRDGDKVMLVGFGVGLSWSATVVRWSMST